MTCSILAPAGPARSRVLSSLYRDDRTPALPTYTILSKMFLENIIRRSEVEEFEKGLLSHQLAKLASVKNEVMVEVDDDGEEIVEAAEEGTVTSTRLGPETVLDRAVMEHNLLSCSKVSRFEPEGGVSIRDPADLILFLGPHATALRQHLIRWTGSASRLGSRRGRVDGEKDDRAGATSRLDRVSLVRFASEAYSRDLAAQLTRRSTLCIVKSTS